MKKNYNYAESTPRGSEERTAELLKLKPEILYQRQEDEIARLLNSGYSMTCGAFTVEFRKIGIGMPRRID